MVKIAPIFNNFIQTKGVESKKNIQTPLIKPSCNKNSINQALEELKKVTFNPKDIAYLKSLGANIRFNSGKEAVNYINKNNIKIKFTEKIGPRVFAQFDSNSRSILINASYKNTHNKADILAISEAILHEAGHAKDEDINNSIQEEIDNLALNVLAHKYYLKKYPNIFDTSKSLIVQDGVNVYEKLFFDNNPKKQALITRLKIKYGYLPISDKKHPASKLSYSVKDTNN